MDPTGGKPESHTPRARATSMAAAAEAGVSASAVELGDLARFHAPVSDFLELSGDAWPLTEEAVRRG